MKRIKIFIFLLCSFAFCGCMASTEDSIRVFENRLESFVGKKVRNVINELGQPTRYRHQVGKGRVSKGTYMIYDFRKKGDDCVVKFKFEKKTLKIIDWDYEGNCLLMDGK